MKKRIFMALLAAVASFAFTSCGDKDDDPKPSGSVATKASYNESNTGCYVEFPQPETDLGTSSTKVEWKWNSNGKVTDYTATVTCTSAVIAKISYETYMSEKDGVNEDGIKSVSQSGNNIIVEYEIDENIDTKEEAILAAKVIAYANGVEGISVDDLIPSDITDLGGDGEEE